MYNIVIIIPAYNEAATISDVLLDYARFFKKAKIVVVDNNSSDLTGRIAETTIKDYSINGMVLYEEKQGKGLAVKKVLLNFRADWWVMTDGDYTYPASAMYKLFQEMVIHRADHGVLDRISSGSYQNSNLIKTKIHKFGNIFFTFLTNIAFGVKFKDVLSGGRIFSMPFIETLTLDSVGFELESELNIHSTVIKASTIEMESEYLKRPNDSVSKLSPISDGIRIFRFIISHLIFRRSDIVFMMLSSLFVLITAGMVIHILRVYQQLGAFIYPSYAVATLMVFLAAVQFALFWIIQTTSRKVHVSEINLLFNRLRREWCQNLDNAESKKPATLSARWAAHTLGNIFRDA